MGLGTFCELGEQNKGRTDSLTAHRCCIFRIDNVSKMTVIKCSDNIEDHSS